MGSQLLVAGAGAAIGSFTPLGPAGGWAVGSAIGGLLFAPDLPDIEGPRLGDLTVQASNYGAPIPKVYGTRVLAGQVIWKTDIKETKHEEDVDSGKGGGQSQTQITYTYSVSFAVGLCEGEIDGVSRIWADGKLLYDFSTDASFSEIYQRVSASGTGFEIYRGTETQTADPTIESFEGSGNVPGFRGLAYIVFDDLQLADFGNRVPNITAEVVDNGTLAYPNQFGTTDAISNKPQGRGWVNDGVIEVLTKSQYAPTARIEKFDWDGNKVDDDIADNGVGGAAASIPSGSGGYVTAVWQPIRKTLTNVVYRASSGSNPREVNTLFVSGPGASTGDDNDPDTDDSTFKLPEPAWPTSPVPGYGLNTTPGIHVGSDGLTTYFFFNRVLGGFTQDKRMFIYPGSGGPREGPYVCTTSTGGGLQTDVQRIGFGHESTTNSDFCMESDNYNCWWMDGSLQQVHWMTHEGAGNFTVQNVFSFNWGGQQGNEGGIVADNGVCLVFTFAHPTHKRVRILSRVQTISDDPVDVADIVSNLCTRSGLSVSDIDVTSLTDEVIGYSISRPSSARSSIEILQKIAFFDIVESDWLLDFKKRGTASVRTISRDDMSAAYDQPQLSSVINTTRTQEKDLPREVRVQYLSENRDQQTNEQSVRRIITQATEERTIKFPVVMSDNKARQVAEVNLHATWESRDLHEFDLSLKHLDLEPGDVITFSPEGGDPLQARIIGSAYQNGVYKVQAVSEQLDSYVSEQEGADVPVRTQSIPVLGPAEALFIDTAVLQDEHNYDGVYTAGRGLLPNWPGGQIYQSTDDGVTFSPWSLLAEAAKVGTVLNELPDARTEIWDRENTITVQLKDNNLTLTSSTETAVLAGANTCVIGLEGRWEVLSFVNATLTATPGLYTLDTLLRGRKGTTDYVDQHAANDVFVLLETTTSDRVYVPFTELLVSRTYRVVTIGRLISTATNFDKQYFANAYLPYPVGNLQAVKTSDGRLIVSWQYAVRKFGEWQDLIGVPNDEVGTLGRTFDVEVRDSASGNLMLAVNTTSESHTFESISPYGDDLTFGADLGGAGGQRFSTCGDSNQYVIIPSNDAVSALSDGIVRLVNISTNALVSSDTFDAFGNIEPYYAIGRYIYRGRFGELIGSEIRGLDLNASTTISDIGTGSAFTSTELNNAYMCVSTGFVWGIEITFDNELIKYNPSDLTENIRYTLPSAVDGIRPQAMDGSATHVFIVYSDYFYIFSIAGGTFAGPFSWTLTNPNPLGIRRCEAFSGGAILTTGQSGAQGDNGFRIVNNAGGTIRTQIEDGSSYPLGTLGTTSLNYIDNQNFIYDNETKYLVKKTVNDINYYVVMNPSTGSEGDLIPRSGWVERFEINGQVVDRTYNELEFHGAFGIPPAEYQTWSRSNFYSYAIGNTISTVDELEFWRAGGGAAIPELQVNVFQVSSTSGIGRGAKASVTVPQ